jgi:predicted nucleic acid-binding protein
MRTGTPLFVSSQILREYFAISTNGSIFKKPLNRKQAIGKIQEFLKRFSLLLEKETTIQTLMDLIEKYTVSRQKIHDLNIAATMIDHGIPNLLTYNKKDFKRSGISPSVNSNSVKKLQLQTRTGHEMSLCAPYPPSMATSDPRRSVRMHSLKMSPFPPTTPRTF